MANSNVKVNKEELLQRKEVIEEINRHLWLESEKAGHDIGFERAAEDWLSRFSTAWMKYHLPQQRAPRQRSSIPKATASRGKRRAAKSYR